MFKYRQIVFLLLLVLAFYVVLPQIGDFRDTFSHLQQVSARDVLAAVLTTLLTYFAAAGTYCFLAFQTLRYWATFLVQLASNFVNRLLPAGIGALGANYAYLHQAKHTRTQAITVVTANNVVGIIGHFIVVVIALAFFGNSVQTVQVGHARAQLIWIAAGVLLAAVIIGLLLTRPQQRLRRALHSIIVQIAQYRQHLDRLGAALLTSITLTLCNVLSLWYCSQALHAQLSFVTVLLIYTLGISVGTITPSPGGLGGVEAGLVAGFVAYHASDANALAIALLYRLISYWLPLVTGGVIFIICTRQGLFGDALRRPLSHKRHAS